MDDLRSALPSGYYGTQGNRTTDRAGHAERQDDDERVAWVPLDRENNYIAEGRWASV